MTDNEIIKALEELELYGGFQPKITILIHNTIYLINRQKTEIEELQRKILSCNTKIEVLQEVKEQLEKDVFNAQMNLDSIVYEYELLKQEKKVVQSEAIKEFAERLKSEYEDEKQGRYINWLMNDIIDNLVKEMAEE